MPGISPQTQAYMQPPPTGADATQAFEQGFGQMAHSILANKFPELVENVITFQVLSSDIDAGSGVGAFIVSLNGITLFVPVVLANNQIKPLEVMYHKDKDIFLPLDKRWLDEVSRMSIDDLGSSVEEPKTLDPDMDIRNLVVPPATGRYAYAAAMEPGIKLAQFLAEAPNYVKTAFRNVLENNKTVLKFAFAHFDKDMLLEALRPHIEKTAAAPVYVSILTPENTAEEFRAAFREKTAQAYQTAVKQGYVVLDKRPQTSRAVETEETIRATTTQESGFYRVLMKDGSTPLSIVISNPQPFESPLVAGKRTDITPKANQYRQHHKKRRADELEWSREFDEQKNDDPQRFLVYTENGKLISTTKAPVGKWVPLAEVTGPLAKIINGTPSPVAQGNGFFARVKAGKLQGTEPVEVVDVVTGSDGVRRIRTMGSRMLVTDSNNAIDAIVAPREGNVTYVPSNFVFLKGEWGRDTLLEGADSTLAYLNAFKKLGAAKVRVIDAGAGMFSFDGAAPMRKLAALSTLITAYNLREPEARSLLDKTASTGVHSFYLVNPTQFSKFASWYKSAQGAPPPQGAPPQEAPPPGMEGMPPPGMEGMPPPGMEGMPPPEMMMPPPPPPPNPVELAAAEVSSDLADQAAQVAQQLAESQRDLSNQLSAIQAVQQRANEIATAQMGGMPPGEAPPVPQQPMPGMPPPEMAAGGMPQGMPPEMGGMPQGMPQGMPPEMAGGMPQGMPPEMAGGMPQGMPPEMMGGAGGAEGPQAMEIANNAGPMMEEAAALNDPEAFEATAIGALASESDLGESVASYVPNLEQALDNLGRILLTLWMREDNLREELGEQDFSDLEKRLRSVFENLGQLVLRLNQTAMTTQDTDEEVS
jgi:hypothetical protein